MEETTAIIAEAPPLLCVMGLGNPGPRYALTRHNIGFLVLDKLADALRLREFSILIDQHFAEARYNGWRVLLSKPRTYMNRSGEAFLTLEKLHGIKPATTVVVYDDVHLPLGTLRLRTHGSAGGHNGIASVIEAAGTTRVPRVRCGVDFSAEGDDLVDHVLSPFRNEELSLVDSMTMRAAEAVLAIMDIGWDRAMNRYNTVSSNTQDTL